MGYLLMYLFLKLTYYWESYKLKDFTDRWSWRCLELHVRLGPWCELPGSDRSDEHHPHWHQVDPVRFNVIKWPPVWRHQGTHSQRLDHVTHFQRHHQGVDRRLQVRSLRSFTPHHVDDVVIAVHQQVAHQNLTIISIFRWFFKNLIWI